jgi:hypothetical protein
MKTQSIYRKALTILGIGIIATLASSTAQAYQTFTLLADSSNAVGMTVSGENTAAGRYFGQFDNGPIFNVFCIDLHHNIGWGDGYTPDTSFTITDPSGPLVNGYYQGGYVSAETPQDFNPTPGGPTNTQRASEIAWIVDNYTNTSNTTFANMGLHGLSTDTNTNLAAIGFSIWDISEDGGNGVSTGQVYMDSVANQASYASLVSYYEKLAALHVFYKSNNATWVQAPVDGNFGHKQDFSLDISQVGPTPPPAVPEPSFVAFALCMAIVAGAFVARRRLAH